MGGSHRDHGSGEAKIELHGDEEIQKALKAMERAARKAHKDKLRPAGEIIAEEMRRRVPVGTKKAKGHRPGKLKRSIGVRPTKRSVKVVNTALRRSAKWPKGYRYGKRLEFDPRFAGRYAFFYPAYEAKKEEATKKLREILDEIGQEWSK